MTSSKVVLVCHGETMFDAGSEAETQYAGWHDVDLSKTGIEQAREIGACLMRAGLKFDLVFTSKLRRSVATAWLACEKSDNYSMPIINHWRLNDRHCGALEGLDKSSAAAAFGDVAAFRKEYYAHPPLLPREHAGHPTKSKLYEQVPGAALPSGESMADVVRRVESFWNDQIAAAVKAGASVLVVSHADTLRALYQKMLKLPEADVMSYDISPGSVMLFEMAPTQVLLSQQNLRMEEAKSRCSTAASFPRGVSNRSSPEGRTRSGTVFLADSFSEMASSITFSVIVLGGGPAGIRAAEEAASRGAKVALIEAKDLITGAPTGSHSKILREAAIKGASTWEEVMQIYDRTISNAEMAATRMIKTYHVKVFQGTGQILSSNSVLFKSECGKVCELATDAIIIATGSKANRFPPTNFELDGVYDSDTIWGIERIPKSLVIQGAGLISVEYALIFAKLGSKVTVIDAFDMFLPMIDSSLANACRKNLEAHDVRVVMSSPFKAVEAGEGSTADAPKIKVSFNDETIECDCLLSACGRHGNTTNIGLESVPEIKVNPRGKVIEVDNHCCTGVDKVYAVGDCASGSMGLATMGVYQATIAARHLLSTSGKLSSEKGMNVKPFVAWTIPEIAWAGQTEEALKKQGADFVISTVLPKHTTKGCVKNADGFLKLIFDKKTGKVLGVHICGMEACELINFGAEAMNTGMTIFEMLRFIFPAVTYHMAYNRAASQAKLRFQGVEDIFAATAWKRLQELLRKALKELGSQVPLKAAVKAVFDYFDVDRSGEIEGGELKKAIRSLGLYIEDSDVECMVLEATRDKEKLTIDYETFAGLLSSGTQSLREESEEISHISGDALMSQLLNLANGTHVYDLVVLGGGPAGLRAAEEAASRGRRVVIIDPHAALSGAPTGAHSKCLREAVLHGAKTWEEVTAVLTTSLKNAQNSCAEKMRTYFIEKLQGTGFLIDCETVKYTPVDDGEPMIIKTDAVIVATGSKANRFPPTNFDLPGVYDSDTIWTITRIPKEMVVQGAGIVSVEYALIFAKLGSRVTVIDAFNDFLPMIDKDLQAVCMSYLSANGVDVIMGTPLKSVEAGLGTTPEAPKIKVTFGERVIDCDCLLSACGRHGNTEGLGLENLAEKGLKVNPRGKLIVVDSKCWTGAGKVYACGDCATGSMGLATTGMHQGVLAGRALYSCTGLMDQEVDMKAPPFAVWTIPEIAWAGITEQQAKAKSFNYDTVTIDFGKCVKGCLKNETGFMKLIYNLDGGAILGVHLSGDDACELVNFGAESISRDLTIFDILQFVFPAITYGYLYSRCCFEGKLRYQGLQNVHAAVRWKRVQTTLKLALDKSGDKLSPSEAMEKAFRVFDKDGGGFVDADELAAALKSLGLEVTEQEAIDMLVEASGDEDAIHIDYQTFCKVLS